MKIKSKLLRAAQVCQAKGELRYILNGIHIKDNYIESADGHTLVRMTMEESINDEIIVNIQGRVPVKAEDSIFSYLGDDHVVRHYDQRGEFIGTEVAEIVGGKFPDIDKIVSKCTDPVPVKEIGVQPEYINRFSKMFAVDGKCYTKLEFFGKDKGIKITSVQGEVNEEYGNPVFIVMPVRL